jgi:hemoglobin/transferrin/lactoferrin receptor protein
MKRSRHVAPSHELRRRLLAGVALGVGISSSTLTFLTPTLAQAQEPTEPTPPPPAEPTPTAKAPPPDLPEPPPPAPTSDGPKRVDETTQPKEPPQEIVVTATRLPRGTFDSPFSVSIRRGAELDRRRAATTAEMVRDQPGVSTNGEGLFNVTPNIRGTIGNQTLVMIDGARLNNGRAFGGPNSLSQTIDPETIDRIEIVRGPGSVLWGSDALGGTVHYFTRAPIPFTSEGTKWDSKARVTLASVDRLQRYRAETSVATETYRIRAGVTTFDVGDLHSGGSIGVMTPSGFRGRGIDVRADRALGSHGVLSFEGHDLSYRDQQSFEISYSRPVVSDGHRRLGLLRYRTRVPSLGLEELQAWTYVQQQLDANRQLNNGLESVTDVSTVSGDLQARSKVGQLGSITWGLHAHEDFLESRVRSGTTATQSFPKSRFLDAALLGLGEFRVLPKLTLVGGVRADLVSVTTNPSPESVPSGLTLNDLRLSDQRLAPTGSIGAVFHAAKGVNVVASGSRGFRAANVSDQVSSGAFRNGYNSPSPGLKPESAYNLEGGVRVRFPDKVEGSLTGWYTFYRDLIQGSPRNPDPAANDCVDVNGNGKCDANEFVYTKKNAGKAHTTGVEAMVTVHLPYDLHATAVGTLMRARLDTTDEPFAGTLPTMGTFSLRWAPKRFYVEVWTRVVAAMDAKNIPCATISSSGAYREDPRSVDTPLLGSLAVSADKKTCTGELPGYAIVGVRSGAEITPWLDAMLNVHNLGNARYRDKDATFDGPGLGVLGSLTLHSPKDD